MTKVHFSTLEDDAVAALGARMKPRSAAVLASFSEGDVVSVEGRDSTGVVVSLMTETFSFPTGMSGEDVRTESISASEDDPVYVVAFARGSMMAVDGSQLSADGFDTEKGADPSDVKELAQKAEEAAVYDYMDDPGGSLAELEEAKRRLIEDRADVSGEAELVNIRGVDDPHVGFDSLPNGWTRKSVLQAWASLGGTFTTCRSQMMGDIRSPERFCAALKDEVLRTELWRNRF